MAHTCDAPGARGARRAARGARDPHNQRANRPARHVRHRPSIDHRVPKRHAGMCERRRGGASDGAAARARVNPVSPQPAPRAKLTHVVPTIPTGRPP
jgi:hypothetical protein